MIFYFICRGYGFTLQINAFDINTAARIILSWGFIKDHTLWCGEEHKVSNGGYTFRRTKKWETVENISFRSPVVNQCR